MHSEFIHCLQKRSWKVDTNVDHDHLHDVLPPLKPAAPEASEQNSESDHEEDEEEDTEGVSKAKGPAPFPGGLSPRTLWNLKRVLITKTSHVGGHKFSGNVIVSRRPLFKSLYPAGTSSGYTSAFFSPLYAPGGMKARPHLPQGTFHRHTHLGPTSPSSVQSGIRRCWRTRIVLISWNPLERSPFPFHLISSTNSNTAKRLTTYTLYFLM